MMIIIQGNNLLLFILITKECIDILAENTILLEFSVDEETKKKLGELYPFVQNVVNEKLGKDE